MLLRSPVVFIKRPCRPVMASAASIEQKTRVQRNVNFGKLQAGYLFPEIARRRRAHQERFPDAQVISLGIGDTTEPIPHYIASAMAAAASGLATHEGYSGFSFLLLSVHRLRSDTAQNKAEQI